MKAAVVALYTAAGGVLVALAVAAFIFGGVLGGIFVVLVLKGLLDPVMDHLAYRPKRPGEPT